MASETSVAPTSRERSALFALGGVAAVVGLILLWVYFTRPPQMGTSEEVFKTVDALYTAVRSRDEKRMAQCEERLKGYRDSGKLPASAAKALESIIHKARSGSWETATERLYDFMRAQRREGVIEHAQHKHEKKQNNKKP